MLVIRYEQLNAFTRPGWKVFEDQMMDHVRQYFPVDFALLGEARAREVVRRGIERADGRGIRVKGDACRYIGLMFVLGSEFDDDPQLPWAQEALETRGRGRVDALHNQAIAYLTRTAGRNGERYLRAVFRAQSLPFEALISREGGLETAVRALLREVYVEKYLEIFGDPMDPFLDLLEAQTARDGMAEPGARMVYALLMALLGSRFATDPMYPWATATARDESLPDPLQKARALHERARLHLEQALSLIRARKER